jgi:hypothetical protein
MERRKIFSLILRGKKSGGCFPFKPATQFVTQKRRPAFYRRPAVSEN